MESLPYLQNLAEAVFKKHVVRVPVKDVTPPLPAPGVHPMAKYVYSVTYVEDPAADFLPINYETALVRHQTLRRNFTKLPSDTKAEFTRRLTDGVTKGFWHIIEGKKLEVLCQPGSGPHFLPSGYVLKHSDNGASTKVRLVLDPSMAYKQRLLARGNAENTIASVLRKLQTLPVCAVQDIQEALFCLRLMRNQNLCFLMDYEPHCGAEGGGALTAEMSSSSRLVAVAVLVTIMGVSQSGLLLALARANLDLQDEILEFLLKELAYGDDLHSGVTAQEI